jgi:hypothetical protein
MIRYELRAGGPLLEAPDIAGRFDREISAELGELGAIGQRLVVERSPRGISAGGGGLRGSIFTEMRGVPMRRGVAVASSLFYAPIVEVGRRPGRRPPATALRLWVQRKLGVSAEAAPQVAFLIARKIGSEGYRGYQMFERTAQQLLPIARDRFEQLAGRIARMLGGR